MEHNSVNGALFPSDLPGPEWIGFEAEGFSRPVTGVIYRKGEALHGMPLGALGTGYLDVDINGTLGRCTMFNTFVPPREMGGMPFLGLAVDGETHVLTTQEIEGVRTAKAIHYWGHYPVADLEYEITSPVTVGLRAWCPFLPGDTVASNTPGAVFEVHTRNPGNEAKRITLAFSFPGPSPAEVGENISYRDAKGQVPTSAISRQYQSMAGNFSSLVFAASNPRDWYWRGDLVVQYALGVIGDQEIRHGAALGAEPVAWNAISDSLPQVDEEATSATVAVDFSLGAGESKVVRFVLAWYAPRWVAQQFNGEWRNGDRKTYVHKYADQYTSAREVAEVLCRNHDSLLRRVLAWQQVIYGENRLPGWLQDSLINILHIFAQNSFYDVVLPRGGHNTEDWYGKDGIFSVNESLVSCPQPSCTPCEWIGSMPILYFFPDLARLTAQVYAHFQRASGEIPFNFGYGTDMDSPFYFMEGPTNNPEYVQLVDRLWLRTNDEKFLEEYYPSVKLAIEYINAYQDPDGDGLPDCDDANHIFDCYKWYGATAPVASLWLGTLRVAERMAEQLGDEEFAARCKALYELGKRSLEEKLWNEEADSYLLYNQPETGRRSEIVIGDQLVGQWVAYYHGVADVYRSERMLRVLNTLKRLNVAATPYGMVNGIAADGSLVEESYYHGIHPSMTTNMAAALMIHTGEAELRETGIEVVRKTWHTMVIDHGLAWNMPPMVDIDNTTGASRPHSEDYYHNTSLWILPSAILGQDLSTFCAHGSLVDRVISAAQ